MKIAQAVLAIVLITSSFAGAESLNSKQLLNKSTARPEPLVSVRLKALQLDTQELRDLRFRLGKERDVGPLLQSLGPGSTGGGESCFQRVVSNYVRLVTGFRLGILFKSDSFQNADLLAAFERIEIQMDKKLKFKGKPVEALNVPDLDLVVIDKKICAHMNNFDFDKRMMGLLLHESFGIARIPDQDYQQSAKMLGQITEFSVGLDDEVGAWLVIRELMNQVKANGSPRFKIKSPSDPTARDQDEISYTGVKVIKTGEYKEGRAMDYRRHECEAYEKRKIECAANWDETNTKYLVILSRNIRGSGWSETVPYYIEFEVVSSSVTIVLGDAETGKEIDLKTDKPEARFIKILNPDN